MTTILIHSDVLIDRQALSAQLPGAWAAVLAAHVGGTIEAWREAYAQVSADWHSYWEDLDLSGDDSLAQWREGRWRIIRAWFRLAGREAPPAEQMRHFLDVLPTEVGRRFSAWAAGGIDALHGLVSRSFVVSVVDPYTPASLIRGMLHAVNFDELCVVGPEALGQVGLEGIAWSWLVGLAGGDPKVARFVSSRPYAGVEVLAPPADLAHLPDLLAGVSTP